MKKNRDVDFEIQKQQGLFVELLERTLSKFREELQESLHNLMDEQRKFQEALHNLERRIDEQERKFQESLHNLERRIDVEFILRWPQQFVETMPAKSSLVRLSQHASTTGFGSIKREVNLD